MLPHMKNDAIDKVSYQDWAEIIQQMIENNSVDLRSKQSNSGIDVSLLNQSGDLKV